MYSVQWKMATNGTPRSFDEEKMPRGRPNRFVRFPATPYDDSGRSGSKAVISVLIDEGDTTTTKQTQEELDKRYCGRTAATDVR